MRRREFLSLLAVAATGSSAHAQQPRKTRRIGVLTSSDEADPDAQALVAAFREELGKLGWTEGSNIEIDIRWSKADVEVMKRSAQEFVDRQPDLILTSSTLATGVMLRQTRTIPIVFLLVADPVGSGYAASLPQPGGNATGFTPIVGSLGGKWVELLKEIAPRVGHVNVMFNPTAATFIGAFQGSFKTAAASLGVATSDALVRDECRRQARRARPCGVRRECFPWLCRTPRSR